MAEKYGIQAKVLESIAETPVSTQTCILFVGWGFNCLKGSDIGTPPIKCTSYKDYFEKFYNTTDNPLYRSGTATVTDRASSFTPSLDGACIQKIVYVKDSDGKSITCHLSDTQKSIIFDQTVSAGTVSYSLYIKGLSLDECARCAFQTVGLESAWFMSVETEITDEAGDADIGTLTENLPAALDYIVLHSSDRPNILCIGGQKGYACAENIAAMLDGGIGGKYSAIGIYNAETKASQISNNRPITANIETAGRHGNMLCVWGSPTTGANAVETCLDGAVYAACVLAAQDGKNTQGLPYRTIGNLDCPHIYSIVNVVPNLSGGGFTYTECTCKQNDMNDIVENGIISFCNHGNRVFSTWGDHTSAVRAGDVDDEIYRFDTNIRMAIAINNRFIDKHKRSIDAPMTLRLRDCIINEQQDFLNGLVALGILVGSPTCKFTSSIDDIGKGYFYFENIFTGAIPAKYIELGTRYTTEGLSAYLEEA